MDKVITKSITSDGDMKKVIGDFNRTNNLLKEFMDNIGYWFKELREDQDILAVKNIKFEIYGSEILKINYPGGIIYVTQDIIM